MANEGGGWGGMLKAMYSAVKTVVSAPVAVLGWAYDQFKQPVAHGSSEVANALFNGQGFVLYGHGVQEAPTVAPVVSKVPEAQLPEPELPEPPAPPKVEQAQVRKGMRM